MESSETAQSPFKWTKVKLPIHLSPSYLGDTKAGIEHRLKQLLLKYVEEVEGVVVGHSNASIVEKEGRILFDNPFIHFHISFDLLTFAPTVGAPLGNNSLLYQIVQNEFFHLFCVESLKEDAATSPDSIHLAVGKVNKVGMDHIGLLVFGIFNASIPSQYISKEFIRDSEEECWRSTVDPSLKISTGDEVPFTVVSISTTKDIISIVGKMEGAAEDNATTKKKRKLDDAREPAVEPSSPLKKKVRIAKEVQVTSYVPTPVDNNGQQEKEQVTKQDKKTKHPEETVETKKKKDKQNKKTKKEKKDKKDKKAKKEKKMKKDKDTSKESMEVEVEEEEAAESD